MYLLSLKTYKRKIVPIRKYSSFSSNSLLLIAEHDNKKINLGILNALTAAKQLSSDITVLVAGSFKGNNSIAKQVSKLEGVKKVVVADQDIFEHFFPEVISPLIAKTQKYFNSSYILGSSSTFGKNIIPRTAALLDVSPITEVISIKSSDTFVRPIYAGDALSTVKSNDSIKVVMIRTSSFEKSKEGTHEAEIVSLPKEISTSTDVPLPTWVKDEKKDSARPDLQTAKAVVSGGRGLKSGKNFELLEALADQLNAAVGASRAAVDAGFVSNDLQIGQTGKIIAPELYVAVGISGAIQHLAGMKDSKVIVAINNDPEAPIFQVADYGIVGDLFQVVPEMTNLLKETKKG